ncbi:MAG: hypothetical protein RLN90_13530 [Balneolaceae bacterium]
MKSVITVLGSFLFSIFLEGFIRIIIIFYHQENFSFFGSSSLPGISWVLIVIISSGIINWISGMLTVTITGFAPKRHLLALTTLVLLFRINEIIQTHHIEFFWYLGAITTTSLTGLYFSYLTQKYSNATKTAS